MRRTRVHMSKRFVDKFNQEPLGSVPAWAVVAYAIANGLNVNYWLTIN